VNITYIIYGPAERELIPRDITITPNWQPDAVLIYDSGGYQVWSLPR
jgi:queuine/archaeosine tRNA-ribosyltransferase